MKIAVICKEEIQKFGFGDYLYFGFQKVCDATRFRVGEETEGFDHYYYIDEGPTSYNEPKFHPASYFAFDFVIPHVWFVQSAEQYMGRMQNFDYSYVFTSEVLKLCLENNLKTRLISFAADPDYHKPYDVEPIYDWIAIWHNCAERPAVLDQVVKVHPNGRVMWVGIGPTWEGAHDYSYHMCTGRCGLNYPRANIVNMRVYEVAGCGVPLITMRVEDMRTFGFVEGEHYLGFETVEELIAQIQWVKDNPQEAQLMASRGRNFVLVNHTYTGLALKLLQDTRMI